MHLMQRSYSSLSRQKGHSSKLKLLSQYILQCLHRANIHKELERSLVSRAKTMSNL